jgi:hypothetical protein
VGQVFPEISMSLDGFVAGPNDSNEQPLGDGGTRLHEWIRGSNEVATQVGTGAIDGWDGSHPIPEEAPGGATTFSFVTRYVVGS